MIFLTRLLIIPFGSGDLAVWVADGLKIFELGELYSLDLFSLHSGLEFIYPARFLNIILAGIYKISSYSGVVFFVRASFLIILLYVLKKHLMAEKVWSIGNLLLFLIPFALNVTAFMDRPACFGVLLGFFIIPLIEHEKLSSKVMFLFFALVILWTNLHSSVLVLLPLLIYKIGLNLLLKKPVVRLALLFMMTILGVCLNPDSFMIFEYALKTMEFSKLRSISEWSPLFRFSYPKIALLYLFSVIVFWAVAYKKNKHRAVLGSLALPLTFAGFLSIRHTIWFSLFVPFYAAKYDLWISAKKQHSPRKFNVFLVSCYVVSLLYLSPFLNFTQHPNIGFDLDAPVEATEILSQTTQKRRIFNQWELGSYLTLKQRHPIFIDGRNIVYSSEIYQQYKSVINASNDYLSIIEYYQIDTFIFKKENFPILKTLRSSQDWRVEYEDQNFILFYKI